MNPIDMLLDENNNDPIVMYNESNQAVTFEQIALVPINGVVYAILKPQEQMHGLAEDEALVFAITEQEDEPMLMLVDEDEIIDAVFEEYYAMLKAAGVL